MAVVWRRNKLASTTSVQTGAFINTVLDDVLAPITLLRNWNPEAKP